MMGTKFTVYDSGTNPGKAPGALLEESNTRQELAAVCYVSGPPFNPTSSERTAGRWGNADPASLH